MDLPVIRPDTETAAGGDAGRNDLAGLRKAAQQFEALLLNELLKNMRATVPENSLWGESSGTKIYQQMHDQALAEAMAESGDGVGIANLIFEQLKGSLTAGEHRGTSEAVLPDRRHEPLRPAARPRVRAIAAGTAASPEAAMPLSVPRSLASYRQQATVGDDLARMRRLQNLAAAEGGAAADSLNTYGDSLAAAATETGLDPGLILAVAVQESGGNPGAVSPHGARGIMQLMPGTAREVGVANPHDPGQGLLGGARYLARMLKRFAGRLDLALAAYNAGPAAVERAGGRVPDIAETRSYVSRVSALAGRLGVEPGMELAKDAVGPQSRKDGP